MTETELNLTKLYVLLKREEAIVGANDKAEGCSASICDLKSAFPELDLDILAIDLTDWNPGIDVLKTNFGQTTEFPSGNEFFDYFDPQTGFSLRVPLPSEP
jgi:hypothetical protein